MAKQRAPKNYTPLNGLGKIEPQLMPLHEPMLIEPLLHTHEPMLIEPLLHTHDLPVTNGIYDASEISKMKFDTLAFDGRWREFIGVPSTNFSAMIYGKPKMGKTYLAFNFADYLTRFGSVMYILADEGIGHTLQTKILETLKFPDKISFKETRKLDEMEPLFSRFKFVFIDLVNNTDIDSSTFINLKRKYPATCFILVFASTKGGNFRGDQNWPHAVDVIIDIEQKGIATVNGRFGGGGEFHIFDKSVKTIS